MSIKNILVCFNGTDKAKRAVRMGAALARRYDAHLTGAFPHTVPHTMIQMEGYMSQAALDLVHDGLREADQRCRETFEAIVAEEEQGLRTSFLSEFGFPNDAIARLGRTYDLIVVAQPDEDSSVYTDPFPDDVAMKSGRPVLIVPRAFEQFELAKGVILAWDGQRAAARALSEAMDLIEDKHSVTVLHVGREQDVRQPGRDIMEHLSRHGLDAALNVQAPGKLKTSDIILNACAEADAGLLVMGAYEHSRFSELLLGGVTRDITTKSHIPVLMAH
ncbi:MAG: universal stress protein [Pseudomonadota bacterium]